MKESKEKLCSYLDRKFRTCLGKNDVIQKWYIELLEKFEIPINISSDIITLRESTREFSDYILFCLTFVINKKRIEDFFTEEEINIYTKTKYNVETIKFPIKFKMIKIDDEQWIGKISVKELIKLKEAQLINYNENAQRAFKRIIKNNTSYYVANINLNAVNQIRDAFHKGIYIPNTITLNLPEDAIWSYNNNSCEFIIKELSAFDITDGYHRYIAIGQEKDLYEDFDYPMELRITNFSESKSQQFIHQEDQKTKMTYVDSRSYDQYNAGNIVSKRLNENPMCNLQGCILRNGNIINAPDLSMFINYFYFKYVRKDKDNEKQRIISVEKELRSKFNLITENNPVYLTKQYSSRELFVIIYIFSTTENEEEIIRKLNKLEKYDLYSIDGTWFNKVNPRKKLFEKLDEILN